MRAIVFILFLFCLYSCNLSDRKVTYKDIIGTWDSFDKNHSYVQSFIFTDSTHLIMALGEVNYSLDTLSNPTLLHIEGQPDMVTKINTYNIYLLVKVINDTLKTQGLFDGTKPSKWDDNETPSNTMVMIKRSDK